jgi:hypothetical protein
MFIRGLEDEIEKLEKLQIEYIVFKDGNLLVPKMIFMGKSTTGLKNISDEIGSIIQIAS